MIIGLANLRSDNLNWLIKLAPEYLSYLRNFLKIYIGLLLIYFYNPIMYKEKKFTSFDRNLVFSAGIFLLLSTTLLSGIEEYIKENGLNLINI